MAVLLLLIVVSLAVVWRICLYGRVGTEGSWIWRKLDLEEAVTLEAGSGLAVAAGGFGLIAMIVSWTSAGALLSVTIVRVSAV